MNHENYDRLTFQKAGHFVPAMQDEHFRRREWHGKRVHILTLVRGSEQILRTYGDTLEAAKIEMCDQMVNTFFAWWTAQQIQANTGTALLQTQTERNILADFIRATHGQAELSTLLNETPPVPSSVELVAVSDLGGDAA